MKTLTTAADIQHFLLSEVAKARQTEEFVLSVRSRVPTDKFHAAIKALKKAKLVSPDYAYPSQSLSCTLAGRYALLAEGSKKLPFPAKAVNDELERVIGAAGVCSAYSYRKNSSEIYMVCQGKEQEEYRQDIPEDFALLTALKTIPSNVGREVVDSLLSIYTQGFEDGRSVGNTEGYLEGQSEA